MLPRRWLPHEAGPAPIGPMRGRGRLRNMTPSTSGAHAAISTPRPGAKEPVRSRPSPSDTGLLIAIVTLFPCVIFRAGIDRALGRLELLAAAGMEGGGPEVRGQKSEVGGQVSGAGQLGSGAREQETGAGPMR